MEKNKQTILKVIHAISFLAFLYGAYSVIKHNFLPSKYRIIALAVIFVIYFVIGALLYARKNNHVAAKALMLLILLVFGGVSAVGAYSLNKGIDVLNRLNDTKKKTVEFSLVVLKDSDINTTEEIKDEKVMTALKKDKINIDGFKEKFKEAKSFDLQLEDGDNYNLVAKKLMNKETKVILLNESFRSIIEGAEDIGDFSDKTRVLENFVMEIEVDPEQEAKLAAAAKAELDELARLAAEKYGKPKDDENKDKEPTEIDGFALYISGIDTYGSITTTSRSDVNIVASINPKTRKVITASIPRDSYVPIAGGGNNEYDKLTHAGIYGVDSSKATIQNLLGIPIEYYARVNFSSLIEMVDVLGGIYVDNPVAFSAMGFDFPEGNIYLDGKAALAFSRERYSLSDGDFDRGRNQMRVIEGIMKKAMSPSILLNYQEILNTILNSTQTNMPSSKIIELINNQISEGGDWEFDAVTVKGYGQLGLPSYAMPGWNLYMYVIDEDSLREVAQELYQNMQ